MKEISRLIESIEADASGELSLEWESDCREFIYDAANKNFKKFERELKTNELALHFAEALATSAKGLYAGDGYFPELIAETLPSLDSRLLKRVYSFLKNTNFANSDKELITKARQAARELQKIGDKYFPEKQLMDATLGNEDYVWVECFYEFWRYLLDGLLPDKKKRRMELGFI